jgi:hypothetical protein
MFSSFKYESIPLKSIELDVRNPRIVTQKKLSSQDEVLAYLYEYEQLDDFIKKVVAEGKNIGAERPYVVKDGNHFVVVEGNTRIAAYKVLTGLLQPAKEYSVPHIAETTRLLLLSVDCSIAPSRDALLPIMASAHFGHGDKSKWGYLGSRKAVYDEWKAGKTIPKIAKAFARSSGEIKELILEYLLYLKALSLPWTTKEEEALLNPAVQFNPPVRFLQTKGHKEKIGIILDTTNLKVVFVDREAPKRFKHLIKKLVISPQTGLGATATFDDVFSDYKSKAKSAESRKGRKRASASSSASASGSAGSALRPGALFGYPSTVNSALIRQLMVEAKEINSKKLPAAGTFLLRNIIEAILKEIIHKQNANPANRFLDLEGCLNLCASNSVKLTATDKNILKEFQKHHLSYMNLGAHGNVIPNPDRLAGARDSIDQFVKGHV